MLNYLWAGMILTGIVYAAVTGRIPDITNAAIDSSREAVTLCITMMGVISLWSGLMEVASRAGVIESISGKLRPVLKFLYPGLPPGHPAQKNIATNMIANFLGLGWQWRNLENWRTTEGPDGQQDRPERKEQPEMRCAPF